MPELTDLIGAKFETDDGEILRVRNVDTDENWVEFDNETADLTHAYAPDRDFHARALYKRIKSGEWDVIDDAGAF